MVIRWNKSSENISGHAVENEVLGNKYEITYY